MAELVESLQRRREALPESAREVWDTLRKRGQDAVRARDDRHLEPTARPTFEGMAWANRVAVSILEEAEGDFVVAAFEIAQRIEREADMNLREARAEERRYSSGAVEAFAAAQVLMLSRIKEVQS